MSIESELAEKVIKLKAATADNKYKAVAAIFVAIVIFALGAAVGVKFLAPALTQHHYTEIKIVEKPIQIQGETKTVTDTQIAYVPKETVIVKYIDPATGQEAGREVPEETDIDATVGKQEINIRLNGQPVTVKKEDSERYVLDKNKITLTQSSTIDFNVAVAPTIIDKTNRWALGVGIGNHGIGGKIDFPLGKNNFAGGWVYGDKNTWTGGAQLRF